MYKFNFERDYKELAYKIGIKKPETFCAACGLLVSGKLNDSDKKYYEETVFNEILNAYANIKLPYYDTSLEKRIKELEEDGVKNGYSKYAELADKINSIVDFNDLMSLVAKIKHFVAGKIDIEKYQSFKNFDEIGKYISCQDIVKDIICVIEDINKAYANRIDEVAKANPDAEGLEIQKQIIANINNDLIKILSNNSTKEFISINEKIEEALGKEEMLVSKLEKKYAKKETKKYELKREKKEGKSDKPIIPTGLKYFVAGAVITGLLFGVPKYYSDHTYIKGHKDDGDLPGKEIVSIEDNKEKPNTILDIDIPDKETETVIEVADPVKSVYEEVKNLGLEYTEDDIRELAYAINNNTNLDVADEMILNILNAETATLINDIINSTQTAGRPVVELTQLIDKNVIGVEAVRDMEFYLNTMVEDDTKLEDAIKLALTSEHIVMNQEENYKGLDARDHSLTPEAIKLLWARYAIITNGVIDASGKEYFVEFEGETISSNDLVGFDAYDKLAINSIKSITK